MSTDILLEIIFLLNSLLDMCTDQSYIFLINICLSLFCLNSLILTEDQSIFVLNSQKLKGEELKGEGIYHAYYNAFLKVNVVGVIFD